MRRRFKQLFAALSGAAFGLMVSISACFAADVDPAYAKDGKVFREAYFEAFGWDEDKISVSSWQGDDGKTYRTRTAGFQKESYLDRIEALIAQLEEQGYVLDLTEGSSESSSGSGRGIVAVAQAEEGTERSKESPDGSNSVFYNSWFYGKNVSGPEYEWCAVFIAWCADQCGYIESALFPKTASCAELYKYLTASQGFVSHSMASVSVAGGSYSPAAGDIVFWCSGGSYSHVGIVTEASDDSLSIISGNCAGSVCTVAYTKSDLSSSKGLSGGFVVHVEYPGFEFGQSGEIQDTVFLFLTEEMGIPKGGACGIMGNLQVECAWNIDAIGDGGTSYGLCQWHNERWKALGSFCAAGGYESGSLEGQLRFLQYELEGTEGAVLPALMSAPESAQGAKTAALAFAKNYERCTPDSYSARQSYAAGFWEIYGSR